MLEDFDLERYRSFPVERQYPTILDDGILTTISYPLCGICRVTFGPEMLEQNLEYIADSLRHVLQPARETIRILSP